MLRTGPSLSPRRRLVLMLMLMQMLGLVLVGV